uniref:Uncharacterized protein n=1 Tax=Rhizophora mucronata TaxID=61149 RepID=A0A2P2NRM7_RHIMU
MISLVCLNYELPFLQLDFLRGGIDFLIQIQVLCAHHCQIPFYLDY